MVIKIIINLFIVFISVAVVVLIKSLKSYKVDPLILININESVKGIASIFHENTSKKVSECFECAERSLKSAKVNDFSIDNFFDSIRK